jgi:hypothetical protein
LEDAMSLEKPNCIQCEFAQSEYTFREGTKEVIASAIVCTANPMFPELKVKDIYRNNDDKIFMPEHCPARDKK